MEEIISLNYWSEQFYYYYEEELLGGRDIKDAIHEYVQQLEVPNKEICEWLSDEPELVDEYNKKHHIDNAFSLMDKLHKLYRIYVENLIDADKIKQLLEMNKNDE